MPRESPTNRTISLSQSRSSAKKDRRKNHRRILEGISFALFAILVVTLGIAKIAGDDDIFWHLATGRWIVEHGNIPTHDVFGIASQNQRWIPFEWGWDVITYLMYRATESFVSLQLVPIVVWLVIFGLYTAILRRMGIPTVIVLPTFVLTLVATLDRMTPRPHVVTLLGISLVVYAYLDFRYCSLNRLHRLWLLPVLFLVWGNMHPGVLVGILLIGLFLISEMLFAATQRNRPIGSGGYPKALDSKTISKIALIFFLCMIAAVCNPNGVHTYTYTFEHTQMRLLSAIREWMSPFSSDTRASGPLWAYKALLVIGAASVIYSTKRKDYLPAMSYIALALHSLRAVRFIADYAFGTTLFTATSVHTLASTAGSPMQRFMRSTISLSVVIVILLCLILMVPTNSLYTAMQYYRSFGVDLDESFFSLQLSDFLRKNNIQGRPFNNIDVGGFLVWYGPSTTNFIDTRNLSDSLGREYYSILLMQPGFIQKLDQYGVDIVLLNRYDLFATKDILRASVAAYCATHRDQWKLVYWDDHSLLYVKNIPKFRNVIGHFEYQIIDPYLFGIQPATFDSLVASEPERFNQELNRKLAEEPAGQLWGIMASAARQVRQYR